jgi:hypothetical protein
MKSELEDGYHVGAESRGVAWLDLFGTVEGMGGKNKIVKISLTSRSDISPIDALDTLMDAVKHAKTKYNLRP